jgi:hypothetical protein
MFEGCRSRLQPSISGQLSYYPALTGRIAALASEGLDSAVIGARLAAEGFRIPRLHERFHAGEVQPDPPARPAPRPGPRPAHRKLHRRSPGEGLA